MKKRRVLKKKKRGKEKGRIEGNCPVPQRKWEENSLQCTTKKKKKKEKGKKERG